MYIDLTKCILRVSAILFLLAQEEKVQCLHFLLQNLPDSQLLKVDLK